MKNVEIIFKDLATHRLTVTPTRITIKIKLNTTKEELDEVERIAMIVAEKLSNVKQSYRGVIILDGYREVRMQDDKQKHHIIIKY